MIPVIISGGAGSRLWPVSRQLDPKPFLRLADGVSLLQKTFLRSLELDVDVSTLLTVTNQSVHNRMSNEYAEINTKNISCDFILEPFGRNTAAAVLSAALFVKQHYGENEILLLLPADHLINDISSYSDAVKNALEIAKSGYLVTFGIQPDYPETGYGYIEADNSQQIGAGFLVKRFVEKPELDVAKEYLASGSYLWNAGMFCGTAKTFIDEMSLLSPNIVTQVANCLVKSTISVNNGLVLGLDPDSFIHVEDISIDYALFEKTQKAVVMPCSIGWSDIGSWLSVADNLPKDENGNSIVGESILHNVSNTLIYSTDRIVAGVDVNNLIVVETADALLIANKDSSQDVKKIFEKLKKQNNSAAFLHQTVHRQWGSYTVLEEGPFYKIKRLEIKSQHAMSLQLHNKRSEHWVIVDGVATITHLDDVFELYANQSTFIPAGNVHRIANNSDSNLVIIEIQCGSYLGEDDIIRFDASN